MTPVFFLALSEVFEFQSEAEDYLESQSSDDHFEEIVSTVPFDRFKERFNQAKKDGKSIPQAVSFACDPEGGTEYN